MRYAICERGNPKVVCSQIYDKFRVIDEKAQRRRTKGARSTCAYGDRMGAQIRRRVGVGLRQAVAYYPLRPSKPALCTHLQPLEAPRRQAVWAAIPPHPLCPEIVACAPAATYMRESRACCRPLGESLGPSVASRGNSLCIKGYMLLPHISRNSNVNLRNPKSIENSQ